MDLSDRCVRRNLVSWAIPWYFVDDLSVN
ncbi:hypothetical protein DSUL_50179 [Desulfovibrionales bacterium]